MQVAEDKRKCQLHERCIIYLQTDLIDKLPEFTGKPTIIQWEGNVVACNEVARAYGICEHIPLSCAIETCPGLLLVGPEQIARLAEEVNLLDDLLRTNNVVFERVSLDECYLEVTNKSFLDKLSCGYRRQCKEVCPNGCCGRLRATGKIGSELLMKIDSSLRLRCRLGISYSKMLARLAALKSSPGKCTIITPADAKDALKCEDIRYILPGFLSAVLNRHDIHTTEDVRNASFTLESLIGAKFAAIANEGACGSDTEPVVARDSWRLLSVQMEIRDKFSGLLLRLLAQVEDEGRIPQVVKVSVRKFDPIRKTNSKEFKTAPIPSVAQAACRRPSPAAANKLMNIILSLFYRLVDFSKPVNLSLLGLSFVRFHEESPRMRLTPQLSQSSSGPSVASRLLRKRDVSLETPICILYEGDSGLVSRHFPKDIFSETDNEDLPAPREKRAKLDIYIKNLQDEQMDLSSPSKLKVADLSLGDEINKKPRSLLQC